MPQKYYNTSETAKKLGKSVDEVKKMLERRELHGYRDGADWKFKVEDIDRLVPQQSSQPAPAAEEGSDVLLSEVEMGQSDPGLSGTVIGLSGGGRSVTDSDIRITESNVILGGDSQFPDLKPKEPQQSSQFEDLKLNLEEELTLEDSDVGLKSSPSGAGIGPGASDVDLAGKGLEDDDLVLGGSGVGSDVSIGGDSGISLVDPADSGFSLETPINLGPAAEEALELGEDNVVAAKPAKSGDSGKVKTDDDFLLTPLEESLDTEDSESGSQVIALDTEGVGSGDIVGAPAGVSMAAMLDEDLSAQPTLDLGGGPLGASPVLGAPQGALSEGAPLMTTSMVSEQAFSGWQITGLAVCVFILVLCGMMMFDNLRNMWGWDKPYAVNSWLMDTILSWIEGS
jgi:excisionase family DNA binding protein